MASFLQAKLICEAKRGKKKFERPGRDDLNPLPMNVTANP
jgi:hypothetical protein